MSNKMKLTLTDDTDGRTYEVPAVENPSFSEWLVAQRAKTEKSLQDVADVCGVTRQAVYSWEQQKTLPTLENVIKLVKFFTADNKSQVQNAKLDKVEASLRRAAKAAAR